MAQRKYRIDAVEFGRTSMKNLRDHARCTLTRLEDGRVIEVTMPCARSIGETIWLEDSQVYFAMWQP